VFAIIRHKLWSDTTSLGLRRDLTVPFPAPEAAIPLQVRAAIERDIERITRIDEPGIPLDEIDERRDRRKWYDAGIRTNYVAITQNNEPCYFQSAIPYSQRDLVTRVYGKSFPELQPGQVLIEGPLTLTRFRGKRVMPAAMTRITDLITNDETKEAIVFVDLDNIPSLKGCVRAGYVPYCLRENRWRFFRQSIVFGPVPAETIIPGVTGPAAD
jgi:hypothetical protein